MKMDLLTLFAILSKLVFYIGALFAIGTILYCIFFETNKSKLNFNSRRIIIVFSIFGLLAAMMSYALASARLTGNINDTINPEMMNILWQTQMGTTILLQIIGFCVVIIGVLLSKMNKNIMAIGGLIVLVSFIQTGHVADIHNFLFQILLLVHLIGIAIWIGILLPLYQLSSDSTQITTSTEIAHRFGKIAMLFVPILIIAGSWIAYQLVNSIENLFTTGYGQTLLIKIAMVSALLSLAAMNKLRFVPAIKNGNVNALKHFRYSIIGEIILVVSILSVSSILTNVLTLPRTHS